MKPDRPTLSVVIPTRNRHDYVVHAVRSVLAIRSPELEVVVHDNSDSDRLSAWIAARPGDARLVHRHTSAPLSMTENFDAAVASSSGRYVAIIGDDDGVSPEIVEAAVWAGQNRVDTLTPSSVVNYNWPDLGATARTIVRPAALAIRSFSGVITYPAPLEELQKCLRSAGQQFFLLPRTYYGIVRREMYSRVREETGTCFPGVSPDMASAVALARYARRCCHVDYPLFVPGSAGRSNAGYSVDNKHIGRLGDQPHLPPDVEAHWSDIVPRYYSVETIWAESAVGAIMATGQENLLAHLDVPLLYAMCLVRHPSYALPCMPRFVPALRRTRVGPGQGLLGLARGLVRQGHQELRIRAARAVDRLEVRRRRPAASFRQEGIGNIAEAVEAFGRYLDQHGLRFRDNRVSPGTA